MSPPKFIMNISLIMRLIIALIVFQCNPNLNPSPSPSPNPNLRGHPPEQRHGLLPHRALHTHFTHPWPCCCSFCTHARLSRYFISLASAPRKEGEGRCPVSDDAPCSSTPARINLAGYYALDAKSSHPERNEATDQGEPRSSSSKPASSTLLATSALSTSAMIMPG